MKELIAKLEKSVQIADQEIQRLRNSVSIQAKELEETKTYLRETVGRRNGYFEVLGELKQKNNVHNGERPHNVPSGEAANPPIESGGQPD